MRSQNGNAGCCQADRDSQRMFQTEQSLRYGYHRTDGQTCAPILFVATPLTVSNLVPIEFSWMLLASQLVPFHQRRQHLTLSPEAWHFCAAPITLNLIPLPWCQLIAPVYGLQFILDVPSSVQLGLWLEIWFGMKSCLIPPLLHCSHATKMILTSVIDKYQKSDNN